MNTDPVTARSDCPTETVGQSQFAGQDDLGLAELLSGRDLKTATDIAEVIRSKPGLLSKVLGD